MEKSAWLIFVLVFCGESVHAMDNLLKESVTSIYHHCIRSFPGPKQTFALQMISDGLVHVGYTLSKDATEEGSLSINNPHAEKNYDLFEYVIHGIVASNYCASAVVGLGVYWSMEFFSSDQDDYQINYAAVPFFMSTWRVLKTSIVQLIKKKYSVDIPWILNLTPFMENKCKKSQVNNVELSSARYLAGDLMGYNLLCAFIAYFSLKKSFLKDFLAPVSLYPTVGSFFCKNPLIYTLIDSGLPLLTILWSKKTRNVTVKNYTNTFLYWAKPFHISSILFYCVYKKCCYS